MEAIKEISGHSFLWHDEYSTKNSAGRGVDELKVVFEQINDFEHSMKFVTEEVRMVQHRFDTPIERRVTNVEKILNKFIKESFKKKKYSVNLIWGIKNNLDQVFKAQASSIKKLKVQLGKIAETVQNREIGSLPSSTKINLKGLAHFITTRSGLNYKPPPNPLVNMVESYVPPILFPGKLKREKEKEQFRKFFENLQQLSINIPFVEALEQMPKYAKFMKDLLINKAKFEETSKVTLNERCSAVLLNKIPIKEKDPGSFTIPCAIGKVGINKALADLGANISLMPYSMFVRLKL
ncbi:hypothetical protein Tco_1487703, partial [Tanacetum coccineum]